MRAAGVEQPVLPKASGRKNQQDKGILAEPGRTAATMMLTVDHTILQSEKGTRLQIQHLPIPKGHQKVKATLLLQDQTDLLKETEATHLLQDQTGLLKAEATHLHLDPADLRAKAIPLLLQVLQTRGALHRCLQDLPLQGHPQDHPPQVPAPGEVHLLLQDLQGVQVDNH
jgi:hypothetical protein